MQKIITGSAMALIIGAVSAHAQGVSFSTIDANNDGQLSRGELSQHFSPEVVDFFMENDATGNGGLSIDEARTAAARAVEAAREAQNNSGSSRTNTNTDVSRNANNPAGNTGGDTGGNAGGNTGGNDFADGENGNSPSAVNPAPAQNQQDQQDTQQQDPQQDPVANNDQQETTENNDQQDPNAGQQDSGPGFGNF